MDIPIHLEGRCVVVREFRRDDVDAVHSITGDHRVTRTLSFDPRTRAQAAEMLAKAMGGADERPRSEYYLAVVLPADGPLVGFVRLALGGVRAAKLGCAVHADHWGNGYATEAASLLVEFGFGALHLHRLTAAVGPDNAASHATVAKIGFRREGTLRDHVFTGGAWRDSVLYSLLECDERPGRDRS